MAGEMAKESRKKGSARAGHHGKEKQAPFPTDEKEKNSFEDLNFWGKVTNLSLPETGRGLLR